MGLVGFSNLRSRRHLPFAYLDAPQCWLWEGVTRRLFRLCPSQNLSASCGAYFD